MLDLEEKDLQFRLRGSWVEVPDSTGYLHIIRVDSIRKRSLDYSYIAGRAISANGEKLAVNVVELNDVPDKLLFSSYPVLGYRNIDHGKLGKIAVYFHRHLTRQYKQGLDFNSLRESFVSGSELNILRWSHEPNEYEIVYKLFRPEFPTGEQALKEIVNSENLSVAVSPTICLAIHVDSKRPVLYYKGIPAGVLENDEEIALPKTSKHLIEEISQYFVCK